MAGLSSAEVVERPTHRSRALGEVAIAFVAAIAGAAFLSRSQAIPFIHDNLHVLVAALFLLLPQLMLRGRDVARYGFTSHPRRLGLAVAAVAVVAILPLYATGFVLLARAACAYAPSLVPGPCWHVFHPVLRWPNAALNLVLAQLVIVALPEELFFRGYLQGRLEDIWPPRARLFGAPVGAAWIVGAGLFALGHLMVGFDPQMLTRFFPGLVFGWMFARTRSILAGTIFHAACNLLMDVLVSSYFA